MFGTRALKRTSQFFIQECGWIFGYVYRVVGENYHGIRSKIYIPSCEHIRFA
jgi:hypothetical protein